MSRDDIRSRVEGIFRSLFDEPELAIQDSTTAADIEDWDSLAHVNLIMAIEGEFSIKFALGEIQALESVGAMLDLIEAKLG